MAHDNDMSCAIFYFPELSLPLIAQQPPAEQPAHPQPQDDFPFFLPRTIPAMTAATTRTKTALMMIVAIFSISHVSIEISSASYFAIFSFMFVVSFVASL